MSRQREKPIRFGIIGCGMIAQWHVDSLRTIPEATVTAAADADLGRAEAFAARNGLRAFGDVDQLLEDRQLDVVCICTPSGLHGPLAARAAAAGKHIVVEKPMAITLEQLREVEEACRIHRVSLCSISQLRFSTAYRHLLAAKNSGAFGRMICGDAYMKYHRDQAYYACGGWRGTWSMDGGGALMNQGIHGVDLLLSLMGSIHSVFARSRTLVHAIETEDTLSAVLEYESGALGVIQAATSICPGDERRLEINGTAGSAVLMENRIASWDLAGEPPANTGEEQDTSRDPTGLSLAGHRAQLVDMVTAIQEGRAPIVGLIEGAKAVRVILAIYRSAEMGRPVLLKELEG